MKKRLLNLILSLLVLSSFSIMGLASAKSEFKNPKRMQGVCSMKNNIKGKSATCCPSMQKNAMMPYSHGMGAFSMDKVAADWMAALALTPEQTTAFQSLETQYKNEVLPLEEKSKAAKLTMLEYLGCPTMNQDKVNTLIDEYTMQKNTVLKARMDYYFHAQQLLTPEQVEKSRAFWADHLKAMPYAHTTP